MAGPVVETAIWLALRARLETLVLNPALPIAWPKEAFTPPQAGGKQQPYLEVRHLPNQNSRLAVGKGSHRRQGIFQVTLKYPVALNHSQAVQSQIAGIIADHFPADLPMPFQSIRLKVERDADVGQGFRDGTDPYWQTPVSIRYRTFN